MAQATISLRDHKGFSQQLVAASALARQLILEATRRTAEGIKDDAIRNAPVATGALKAAIQTVYFGQRLVAHVRAFPGYAIAQEMGYKGWRGRGNRGHRMPLSRELISWAQSKGLNPFAVAKKILEKGYKPRPRKFLLGAVLDAKNQFIREVMKVLKDDLKSQAAGGAK